MSLGLDFSMAGSEGSDKREQFKRDVAKDLASASGLPPANFRIKNVSPGSIILDIEVMPDPSAPGTHVLAAKGLAEQAVDPSSKLRSGKLTSHATRVTVTPPKSGEVPAVGELNKKFVVKTEAKKKSTRSAPPLPKDPSKSPAPKSVPWMYITVALVLVLSTAVLLIQFEELAARLEPVREEVARMVTDVRQEVEARMSGES